MRFCCLGSGSKGNITLVQSDKTTLMVDCGFGLKESVSRLQSKGLTPNDITAILVTHEHSDHIGGVSKLAKKYDLPVYATKGTARSGKLDGVEVLNLITLDQHFSIEGMTILPVAVPHDANEPCQFIFQSGGKSLGVMTDLGSISAHVFNAFKSCDALLLEANHDVDMLWGGRYPPSLKHRVAGNWGHLSNVQAQQFADQIDLDKLQCLVLGHISEQNNTMDIVKRHFEHLQEQVDELVFASQGQGFDWLAVK